MLQETLVQAGSKPPKEAVQDFLLVALKENEDQLPDAVKQVSAASQEGIRNPHQEGKQDSIELSKVTQRYKILVKKKMDLQGVIQGAKEALRLQLEDLQNLDVNLKQAKAHSEAVQVKLAQTVDQDNAQEHRQEFDKFLKMAQKFGVELAMEQQMPKPASEGKEVVPAPLPKPASAAVVKDNKRPHSGEEGVPEYCPWEWNWFSHSTNSIRGRS